MAPPLQLRPDPTLRLVWSLRGALAGLLLVPTVGWPLVLVLGVGVEALHVPTMAAFLGSGLLVYATWVIGVAGWAARTVPALRIEVGADGVTLERGSWLRTTTAVPYSRILSVAIRRGPLLRTRGLATVELRLAASAGEWLRASMSLPGLRTAEADTAMARIAARLAVPPVRGPATAPPTKVAGRGR